MSWTCYAALGLAGLATGVISAPTVGLIGLGMYIGKRSKSRPVVLANDDPLKQRLEEESEEDNPKPS